MPGLTLQHPIRTLDNEVLFRPRSLLTEETLEAVISSHRTHSYPTSPLLSYGSVKPDCLNFLSTPPFLTIFSDENKPMSKSNPHYTGITVSTEKRGSAPSYNVYGMTAEETDPKNRMR